MYNEYFGFKESPFSIAPDPRYLYMTAQHREALAHLVYGLNSEGGCILLTGEVGTGKTTICRCLLEQIPEKAKVALVLNPKVNEIELLETICDELNIDYPKTNNSVKTYTDRIYSFLIENNRKSESTVLIIDEAQNLDSTVLEQLRLLTNLETDKRKLLQIIILGQPELLDILAKKEMRQLAQRITARFHLEPLSNTDIKAYVDHRLAVAGQNIRFFPDNSLSLLYKLSNGIPRLVNVLCDRALLGAYVENQYTVTPEILKKAAKEVFGELKNTDNQHDNKRWLLPAATIAGITALSTLLFFNFKQPIVDFSKSLLTDNNLQAKNNFDSNSNNAITESSPEENNVTQKEGKNNNEKIVENTTKIDATNIPPDNSTPVLLKNGIQADNTLKLKDFENTLNRTPNSLSLSYDTLFNLWGVKYVNNSDFTGCKQAEKYSLLCLHKQGNLESLKEFNRPAALKVTSPNGKRRYITVTKIDDDKVTVYTNGKPFELTSNQLDKYWQGQFIILWKKPDGYTQVIKPGDKGAFVGWIQSHFNDPEQPFSEDMYSYALSTKVRAFQKEHNLIADGFIGPVTIIYLNSKSSNTIPTLIKK